MSTALTFGPVPSRRLGRSLGINHIPPKVCSYSCIYCQVGRTTRHTAEPSTFPRPEEILAAVEARMDEASARGEPIDYVTFVPDGEPTLDRGLGRAIRLLGRLGVPVAVITNGSLLWRPEVREALGAADWVSVKVDAVAGEVWRRVNHPAPGLEAGVVLEGIQRFAAGFGGTLCTETMLVKGVNDGPGPVGEVAGFAAGLEPATAYLAVPTRPPAMPGVRRPGVRALVRAHRQMTGLIGRVELLIGYEGDAFASTGDLEADLLAVAAVHPLRRSAVGRLLAEAGAGWDRVEALIRSGDLACVTYDGERYYLRRPAGGA